MGITYRVDAAQKIVFAEWTGIILAKDIAEYWARLVADEEAMACGRSITDVRNCEMKFKGEEMRVLANRILEPAFRGKNWRTAVIVEKNFQYGVARQQEMFSDTFMETRAFPTEAAANQWVLR